LKETRDLTWKTPSTREGKTRSVAQRTASFVPSGNNLRTTKEELQRKRTWVHDDSNDQIIHINHKTYRSTMSPSQAGYRRYQDINVIRYDLVINDGE
jgi:hypothetical protein